MKYKILKLKTIEEDDGKLTVFELNEEIPFEIKRVFSIYEIPSRKINRANHASSNTEFFFQVIKGKVDIMLDDGKNKELLRLDQLNYGLYVPKMVWIKTFNFSSDAVLQVYASTNYKECEYINDYKTFITRKEKLLV